MDEPGLPLIVSFTDVDQRNKTGIGTVLEGIHTLKPTILLRTAEGIGESRMGIQGFAMNKSRRMIIA